MTLEQIVTITELMSQYQLLGISGEETVVLDLGAGATVEIWSDVSHTWLLNEKPHRTDGPASIWANGSQFWYLNGREMTQTEHARRMGRSASV